jgi:hypothetical protein
MKTLNLKALVLYHDVFEYESFPIAVWRSTKNQKLLHRLILGGSASIYEKRRGPIEKNSIYTVRVKMQFFKYTNVRIEKGL